jgi:dihydrodipicolinate synthase/N-acetylneuraminate lyase
MKTRIVFGSILTIVALTGTAILSGCSSTATTSAASCKQQYKQWQSGPAQNATKRFTAAQENLSTVGSTKNLQAIKDAVETEGKAAADLAAYPVPVCADPHGDLAAVLDQVHAAAAKVASANGLAALVQAMEPLNKVPTLESDFTAEVQQATGIS